jgi:hypothetical protein
LRQLAAQLLDLGDEPEGAIAPQPARVRADSIELSLDARNQALDRRSPARLAMARD